MSCICLQEMAKDVAENVFAEAEQEIGSDSEDAYDLVADIIRLQVPSLVHSCAGCVGKILPLQAAESLEGRQEMAKRGWSAGYDDLEYSEV